MPTLRDFTATTITGEDLALSEEIARF